ncbi:MAG TPA: iron ABC transporter permease [Nitrospira sp.]|nr:iron ABC transporter permease [Nitrospira sp.]
MALPSRPLVPVHPASLSPSAREGGGAGPNVRRLFSPTILTFQRWLTVIGGLAAASLAVCVVSLLFGAARIEMRVLVEALWDVMADGGFDASTLSSSAVIMLHLRLPRVLAGFLVGGGLAAVGVALQALLRNALADPYVLGVSSGAALGASLAMLFGLGTILALIPVLPLFGFAGGLLALIIIYRLARSQERLPVQSLLLAGVILNAILTAVIMFITSIMEPTRSAGLMAWLMGSLTAPDYTMLAVFALYAGGGVAVLLGMGQTLNILTLGEEAARSLGIEVERVKKRLFIVTALLTGAIVSISGMIGFVGMVVPHAVRMVFGTDHRLLLPASTLVGGMFLVVSDTMARTLFAPTEVPVGIVTALVGGPFFLYLLLWRKDRM